VGNKTNFFNQGNFLVNKLVTNPKVVPDEAFSLDFYIYDSVRSADAATVTVALFSSEGRNETKLATIPVATQDGVNTWNVTATIPTAQWDGVKSLLLKFTITDLAGIEHIISDYLFKKGD